ncbi:hypothetical protein B0T20DRAFT_249646 [Sordaria brevicollis]|uniref:Uncharacterized protein n=1 Tax=Sordaria brevicollis TaxID=83679 RepID=A0AAE0PCL4_SORBR|nr:hypothetical protein B0T20DRAFT_249646 [Sordaria brevicollis]
MATLKSGLNGLGFAFSLGDEAFMVMTLGMATLDGRTRFGFTFSPFCLFSILYLLFLSSHLICSWPSLACLLFVLAFSLLDLVGEWVVFFCSGRSAWQAADGLISCYQKRTRCFQN